jgi:hypothetical protein
MTRKIPLYVSGLLAIPLLGFALGCSQLQHNDAASTASAAPVEDAQVTSSIQAKLYADPVVQTKQISVQTAGGVVTLAGVVASEAERSAAASAAATVPGVKTVVNNLTVTQAQPVQTAAAAPMAAPVATSAPRVKPHAARPVEHSYLHPAPTTNYTDAPPQTAQVAPITPPPAPVAPVAPPAPVRVTVQSGTTLSVRLIDEINSETAQPGQTFRATLDSPLSVDGDVVVPEGYDVQGHVVDVKSAGKFAGRSSLELQLDRIQVGTKYYTITTSKYSREGSSRTKNTVAKVGAGSAIGAIIGGLAGGGKGAAIGAAAGGGLGGGVQAATKGQQVTLASETVLTFELQSPLTVTPTTQSKNAGRPKLETPAPAPDSVPQPPPQNPQRR